MESLYFLFSSARESDCFALLVFANKNTYCCVCAAAILAASLTAAHSLCFCSPPTTHSTVQQQHVCVHPRTQGRSINVLVGRRVHDHEILLRWLRRFAGGVSLQDKVDTGRPVGHHGFRCGPPSVIWSGPNRSNRPVVPLRRDVPGGCLVTHALCGLLPNLMA